MRLSQKMIYLFEQLDLLEKAIVDHSHQKYIESFREKESVPLGSPESVNASLFQHFRYYEGPLVARYMLIIQLYSIYERYSISFAKRLSKKDNLI